MLEFCKRGTLQDLLTGPDHENLTWGSHKLGIALGLARALAHLHKQSPPVIHRDIKPENGLLPPTRILAVTVALPAAHALSCRVLDSAHRRGLQPEAGRLWRVA